MRTPRSAAWLTLAFLAACTSGPEITDAGTAADVPRTDAVATDAVGRDVVESMDAGADATASDSSADAISFDVPATDAPSVPDTGTADAVIGPDAAAIDAGTSADAGGGTCTTPCATGFHCASGGYCVNAAGVPAFGHVHVIVMENHSLSSIRGVATAPYINGLMTRFSLATNYGSAAHPSLPNYIALTGADTFGVACDCRPTGGGTCNALTCNILFGGCQCTQATTTTHIGDQLETAGIEWREYGEGMGTPCNTADNSGSHYAVKHIPFLYYDNVRTNAARCTNRVRDFGEYAADLTAGTFRFSFISPNLCNDQHDACSGTAIGNGDTWLSANVPAILARPGFAAGGTDVLFIVWDEQDNSMGTAPIGLIIVSPLARAMSTTAVTYNHYSLVATIEDGFGVPRIRNAVSARPINDIWR